MNHSVRGSAVKQLRSLRVIASPSRQLLHNFQSVLVRQHSELDVGSLQQRIGAHTSVPTPGSYNIHYFYSWLLCNFNE